MTADDTVFVVDDDEAIRDSLQALFESDGLSVETYDHCRTFLDSLGPGQRGCVVLDIRMPDMDGLELQRHLVDHPTPLPIIIITGHGDVPLAVKAMKSGAVDFIEKPFQAEMILECVHIALEQGRKAWKEEHDSADAVARVKSLTERERQVLQLLAEGNPNKVIAFELGISPRTVEVHRSRVMSKLGVRNLSQLVRLALLAGIGPGSP